MNKNGYTLIELLVATAIFVIILTGMTIILVQQQRQFTFTKEAVDLDQTARAVLDFVATEIRNASSRQGKTFSLSFLNGGSPGCTGNTADAGSETSPPDCITIYTWDITRGMDRETNNFPSTVGSIQVLSKSTTSVTLQAPLEWIDSGKLIESDDVETEVLLGFRSRISLCFPNSPSDSTPVDCGVEPELCTECSAILRGTVDGATSTITITSVGDDPIVEQNFSESNSDFTDFNDFLTNNFEPSFSLVSSEMSLIDSKTLRIDPANGELEMSINEGPFQPIAGGLSAPGIVDMQFVFNLQNTDGTITKVGVLTGDNRFTDFEADTTLQGRENDIRTVEIYVVIKSKMQPRKLQGGMFTQTLPQVGDVLERTVGGPATEPQEGFIYRIFSTTVYPRNMGREEFG